MSNKTTSHVHEPLVGRVQKIDQLAAFQKDSIVSTRVIQKAAGNVTFFAFDEGQELSEHAAPFDALLCVFDGETSVMVKDAWHTLKTGDGIILPANVPHAVKAVTPFKMMLTMIRS